MPDGAAPTPPTPGAPPAVPAPPALPELLSSPPVLTVADARVEPAQPVDVEQAVVLAAFAEQGADVGHDGALARAVHAGDQHGVGTGGSGQDAAAPGTGGAAGADASVGRGGNRPDSGAAGAGGVSIAPLCLNGRMEMR